jgi:hypothetical protein
MAVPFYTLTTFELQRKVRISYVLLSLLTIAGGCVANMFLEVFNFAFDCTNIMIHSIYLLVVDLMKVSLTRS